MKVLAFLVLVLVFLAEACNIHQADLEFVPTPLSATWVLGLQVYATKPRYFTFVMILKALFLHHFGSPISIL